MTVVTDKLAKHWGIAVLPDGRFLVTEKKGSMCIVSKEGQVSQKIEGVAQVETNDQGDLLGIMLDPGFDTNRTLYWAFTKKEEAEMEHW